MSNEPAPIAPAGDPASSSEPAVSAFTPPASQEELDKIINTAVARTHRKYADYDDLKSKVSGLDESLSKAKGEGRAEAESELASKLFDAEVRAAAQLAGFHDPADAVAQFGDHSGVVSGLDVDKDKLSARLTEIATEKPYLVKADQPKPKIKLKPSLGESPKAQDSPSAKGARAAAALREFSSKR